ncbi:hypothetical protein BV22DRAFT_1036553 [Leucogyrophana mollusca]|uniref:Uncharacterized protein n=1 Tax=Leucogyrophana mollusca TaxID=85980 RepID=A0ACB8BC74_9AGAM|nr:hypothetical protein BV22DRAFT_1036553 [Leucogyrophana mollusca]
MRPVPLVTTIIAAAATLELVSATCKTHTPSGARKWQMDFFSEPNCAGIHKPLNGTAKSGGSPGPSSTCHNLGYFDCDLVQSFVFSPAKMSDGQSLSVVLYEGRDCKGKNLGQHGGAWTAKHVVGDQRLVNSIKIVYWD